MGTLKLGVHRIGGAGNFPFHECVYSCAEQIPRDGVFSQSFKYFWRRAVFARLVVFQPDSAHAIRKAEQKS